MSVQGVLQSGEPYSIVVASDPGTPGTVAMAVVWVPNVGSPPSVPEVHAIAPGMSSTDAGIVPPGQMLLLDFDLPDAANAKITVTVVSGKSGAPPTANVAGALTSDDDWTFLVLP